VDIRCLARDARGEPTDPVLATAEGTVVYVNRRPSLSNYGNYVILQHRIEGLDIYSLYAHLRAVRPELRPGTRVRAGENLGTMGRTSNTPSHITQDRAHVHFELDLRVSDRFAAWRRVREPKERNDHGEWNGQNLLGLDPAEILRAQARLGTNFSLRRFLREQPELCRVRVRGTGFSWARRYALLIEPDPKAPRAGASGYELVLNYYGLPFRLIPSSAAELPNSGRPGLVSVNEREQAAHPYYDLVVKRAGSWVLGRKGDRLLDLLTY
jgi:murein DD-endopeptidase MepM/ murein hydrolase activator NlpD